jgi:hypothetical protein
VHFARGGPWLENWKHVDYGDLWRAERDRMLQDQPLKDDVDAPSLVPAVADTLAPLAAVK